MTKDMELLHKLMPPPPKPTAVPSEPDWTQCERELTVLPDDYKEFIAAYGSGSIGGFMSVFNFGQDLGKHDNFITEVRKLLEFLDDIFKDSPEEFPAPCFPKAGGYLPFGTTDNGDYLCWVTEGKPNNWTVAVIMLRASEVFNFNGGLLQFLAATFRSEAHWGPYQYETPDGPPVLFQAY